MSDVKDDLDFSIPASVIQSAVDGWNPNHPPRLVSVEWNPPAVSADIRRAIEEIRSNNRILVYGGQSATLIEWAERFNVRPDLISRRLARKWDLGKALMTPPNQKHWRKSMREG